MVPIVIGCKLVLLHRQWLPGTFTLHYFLSSPFLSCPATSYAVFSHTACLYSTDKCHCIVSHTTTYLAGIRQKKWAWICIHKYRTILANQVYWISTSRDCPVTTLACRTSVQGRMDVSRNGLLPVSWLLTLWLLGELVSLSLVLVWLSLPCWCSSEHSVSWQWPLL